MKTTVTNCSALALGVLALAVMVVFEPALAQNRIAYENNGARLSVSGPITPPLVEAVRKELENPLTTSVQLNSNGEGDVTAARAFRDLLREKKLNSFVAVECSALCMVVFLGGERRFMSENAKLGFAAAGTDTDALRKEAAAQNVSDAFLQKVMASPQVTFPTPDELLDAGVVTDVIAPGDEPRF